MNKEQTEDKDKKNDNKKNTIVVMFDEDVLMLSWRAKVWACC